MKKNLFGMLIALAILVGLTVRMDTTRAQGTSGDVSGQETPSSPAATVLAGWGFEGVTVSASAGTTPQVTGGTAAADTGVLAAGSSFTGSHASASTVWSTPAGNGSTKSLSSNNWAVGDYYQFQFATTGYTALTITWDQTGSNTGPRDFKVQYSTNGTSFTDATGTNSTYSLTAETWTSGSPQAASTRTIDLSGVTALNSQATVYIRLVVNSTTSINGGSVAAAGTGRVDNFTASGTAGAPAHVQHIVDFDGDGKTDWSILRDGGSSYIWISLINGSTTDVRYAYFGNGALGDLQEPADFDGDGKTDPAVYRPNAGTVYALRSTDGFIALPVGSGGNGDFGADYTGDGKSDAASVAASGADLVWTYTASAGANVGAPRQVIWGYSSDFAAPGDYNGDGKADFCAQRDFGPVNNDGQDHAMFFIHYGDGVNNPPIFSVDVATMFGYGTDTIVPGDYDGDGATDIAIARNISGNWFWWYRKSSDGTVAFLGVWGVAPTDKFVQGDYDGDGKTDIAVWRPSTQFFYVVSSQTGNPLYVKWGQAGDEPTADYNSH